MKHGKTSWWRSGTFGVTRERFAIICSILALIISLFQAIVTSPLIIEYYKSPKLELSYSHQFEEINGRFTTAYVLYNHGRSSGKNIRITFVCFIDDVISIDETKNYSVSGPDNSSIVLAMLCNKYVDIPKINAHDDLHIYVETRMDRFLHWDKAIKSTEIGLHVVSLPGFHFYVPTIFKATADEGDVVIHDRAFRRDSTP